MEVSDEEWKALEDVVKEYNIEDFKGLHDAYLATDVLALADCLDNFRKCFREIYDLDVLHFLTLPKAAWNGALYKEKLKIELVTDWRTLRTVPTPCRGQHTGQFRIRPRTARLGDCLLRCQREI